jgi:hypothetical protein
MQFKLTTVLMTPPYMSASYPDSNKSQANTRAPTDAMQQVQAFLTPTHHCADDPAVHECIVLRLELVQLVQQLNTVLVHVSITLTEAVHLSNKAAPAAAASSGSSAG